MCCLNRPCLCVVAQDTDLSGRPLFSGTLPYSHLVVAPPFLVSPLFSASYQTNLLQAPPTPHLVLYHTTFDRQTPLFLFPTSFSATYPTWWLGGFHLLVLYCGLQIDACSVLCAPNHELALNKSLHTSCSLSKIRTQK